MLTPKYDAILDQMSKKARVLHRVRFGNTSWSIRQSASISFEVKVEGQSCTCSCNIPGLNHFPYEHVISACARGEGGLNMAHHSLASRWYHVENYKAAYTPEFKPVPDSRHWATIEGPRILPPNYKPGSGRPATARIKGNMDEGRQGVRRRNRCSLCKIYGHNKKRCPVLNAKKRGEGEASTSVEPGGGGYSNWYNF